jgi:DNA-binding NarL/FixJ family response regulator
MKSALILEDLPESQEMLSELLHTAFAGIAVHATPTVSAALDRIAQQPLDLALIDLALPDGSGVTVIQALAERHPHCLIVVATIFDDDEHLFPALRAGAQGYLLKDETMDRLVAQLQGIVSGQPPLSPAVARRLLKHFREPGTTPDDLEVVTPHPLLTVREREVLLELSRGVTLAKIAQGLGISRHTVGDHVKNIYRKLNISSRAQAALHAHNLGLMTGI